MSYSAQFIPEGNFAVWVLQKQVTMNSGPNPTSYVYTTNDGTFVYFDGTLINSIDAQGNQDQVAAANILDLGPSGMMADNKRSLLNTYAIFRDSAGGMNLRVYKNGKHLVDLLQGGLLVTGIADWSISPNGEWISVTDQGGPQHYALWKGT